MAQLLEVNDAVDVIGGKYRGRTGLIVQVTQKMLVLRLSHGHEEVRILQSSVRVKNKANLVGNAKTVEKQLPDRRDSLVISRLKNEIADMQDRLDVMTKLLEALELSPL
jgi:transcription elongation factor